MNLPFWSSSVVPRLCRTSAQIWQGRMPVSPCLDLVQVNSPRKDRVVLTKLQESSSENCPPSLAGRGLRVYLPLTVLDKAADKYPTCLRCELESK